MRKRAFFISARWYPVNEGRNRPLAVVDFLIVFVNWIFRMNSIFNVRNSLWTLSFSVFGWALGLCFNFYTTGNLAIGYGILGIPLGGLFGATFDKNRMKQYSMLFLFIAVAALILLKG